MIKYYVEYHKSLAFTDREPRHVTVDSYIHLAKLEKDGDLEILKVEQWLVEEVRELTREEIKKDLDHVLQQEAAERRLKEINKLKDKLQKLEEEHAQV